MLRTFPTLLLLLALAPSPRSQDCSSGLVYDDGIVDELVVIAASEIYVSRFEPAYYPFELDRVCIALSGFRGGPGHTFEAVVFEDQGGRPGARIAAAQEFITPSWVTPRQQGQFTTFSFTGLAPPLRSGALWIGVRTVGATPVRPFVTSDDSNEHPWLKSRDGGLTWKSGSGSGTTLMIRADKSNVCSAALSTVQNGSGTNPLWYTSSMPLIGSLWTGNVDTRNYQGNPLLSRVLFHGLGSSSVFTPAGELLIDLSSPRYLMSGIASGPGVHQYNLQVPDDTALIGAIMHTQAVVIGTSGPQLTNALELRFDCR